ncbi:MAG: RCC1 repeat-containing protein, partial [Candidatus Moranbacteria bacterium GW2011_GWC2_37_8]
LFKSAAVNHLRIQELMKNPDGTYQLTVKFGSYSELKNYQKKLRRLTVSLSSAVAMVAVAVIVAPYVMNPNRSSAANYSWVQASWDAVGNIGATIEHPAQGTTYVSKENIDIADNIPDSTKDLKLAAIAGQKKYTNTGNQDDSGALDGGFNMSGADFQGGNVALGSDAGGNLQLGTAAISVDAARIATRGNHSLAIKTDGTLWAWGRNTNGQLGDGSNTHRTTPVQIAADSTFSSVAAGEVHSLAIKTDGTLWAWGSNTSGQLGDGSTTQRITPVQIAAGSTFSAITAGEVHSLAIKTDGTLWAWGNNANAQLGDGSTTQRITPVQIAAGSTFSAVAAGTNHSLALKTGGTLWAWGANSSGQLGDGSTTQRTTPVQIAAGSTFSTIAAGWDHSLALKTGGTLWAWGRNIYGQVGNNSTTNRTTPVQIAAGSTFSAVAGGNNHSLAIKTDGTLWAWGSNAYGQLGDGSTTQRNAPVQIAAGSTFSAISGGIDSSVVIKPDGTLWAWGVNYYGQLGNDSYINSSIPGKIKASSSSTTGFVNASILSAGPLGARSMAIKTDGTLWAWGYNSTGELGDGSTTNRRTPYNVAAGSTFSAVASGQNHSVAVKTDGTLWSWGDSTYGQIGDTYTAQRTAPVQIAAGSTFSTIAAGFAHSLAIKTDGTLWSWGYNSNGQLGDGSITQRNAPVQIAAGSTFSAISAGQYHSLALKTDGTLWAWGANSSGQLGDGSITQRTTPVQIDAGSTFSAVAAGSFHSLALKTNGTLWVWGSNGYGQLADGTFNQRTTPFNVASGSTFSAIATGNGHSLALKTDGTLWGAGSNSLGALGTGGPLVNTTELVQIAAGSTFPIITANVYHSLAIKTDGTLWAWGYNSSGQLGDNTATQRTTPIQTQVYTYSDFSVLGDVSYFANGTYTSPVINTGQKNQSWGNMIWNAALPTNRTLAIKARSCDDAACSSAETINEAATKAWTNCGELSSVDGANSVSLTSASPNCITNGDRYIQYQAIFGGTNITATPKLYDIAPSFNYYSTTLQKLISSPFNSTDKYTSIGNLTWNATDDAAQGTIEFQIRTANSQANLATAKWCGPTKCAEDPNLPGGKMADAVTDSDFYISKTGNTINSLQSDHNDNQWLQYALFIKSAEGNESPILSDVTTSFAFNNPPSVSLLPNAPNQISGGIDKGKIKVEYQMSDTEQLSAQTRLFYQPGEIVVGGTGINENGLEDIMLTHDEGIVIPNSGTILVDQELIAYSGIVVNSPTQATLTVTGRAQQFAAGAFMNASEFHLVGAKVFFSALNPTGQINALYNTDSTTYSTLWNAKSDATFDLDGKKWTKFRVALAANDGYELDGRRTGVAISDEFVVDFGKPIIENITSTTTDGKYSVATGVDINVTINFVDSEGSAKNVTSTGTVNIVLETGDNDYNCLVSEITIPSSSAVCSYQVNDGDASNDLNAKSVSGNIVDQFGNALSPLTIPQDNNLADLKNIIIDTAAPVVDNITPVANAFINSTTSAENGSDISYTTNETLIAGSYIKFTSTSGTDIGTLYTCTLQGTALNSGTHNNFELKSDTNNCVEAQTALNDESIYTFTIHAIDEASNAMDATNLGITFDTINPSASLVSLVNDLFINSVTSANGGSDISYNLSEELQAGTYLKFTRTDGIVDVGSPRTCNLTGTELDEGEHNNVDLDAVCGGFSLVDGTVYSVDMRAIDLAGNESNASQKTNITFDQTAPILLSFTSDKANVTAQAAYGKDEVIDIRAVYNEPLNTGSTVTVQLENSANPAVNVVLSNIENVNEKGILYGTFTVDGPRKGYDTQDLNIHSVVFENAVDMAENAKSNSTVSALSQGNLADNKDIAIDTGTPILMSFSAKKPPSTTSGSFKDESLRITATYSKPIETGSITIHLNTEDGVEDNADILLNNISGSTIYGDYAILSGDNAESLNVSRITAQSATDFKGNPLTNTGTMSEYDAYFAALPGESISAVINISNIQVDTTSPALGTSAISYAVTKTNSQTPTATLSVTDNFNLSDGTMQFSLNGGTSWCAAIPFASSYAFDVTNSSCGGNSTNEIKVVTAKFIDQAGNESSTADTTIEYDNSKPVLEKITAEQGSGIYGPGSQIKLIAQYNETLVAGSNMTIQLNNGKQILLDEIENNNQLVKTYTVGVTGALEDTEKLKVASIISQNVSDTANPTNTQDSTSLSGITDDIDSNSIVIVVDTTAPAGTITIDRSATSGQIVISATDVNGMDEAEVEIKTIDSSVGCGFTNAWTPYAGKEIMDLVEINASAIKGCVQFKDKSGNISETVSTVTPETPSNIQLDDVSNVGLTPPFFGSIFTWQKPANFGQDNVFSRYEELRCESPDGEDCVPEKNSSLYVSDSDLNYYFNTGLIADKKYCYQVRFRDIHGNYSKLSEIECSVTGQAPAVVDSAVNVVSGQDNDIVISSITETSAKVSFKTQDTAHSNKPIPSKAIVQAYSNPELTQLVATSPEESDYLVNHEITIAGLSAGIQYYLKITATDSSDINNSNRTTTLGYVSDISTPYLTFITIGELKTISDVKEALITDAKAVITFKTNQDAKCFIDFKDSLSATYNDLSANIEADYAKNHSITLTQLIAKTSYDYKITCADSKIAIVTSAEYHFITSEKGMTQGELDATRDSSVPEISNIALMTVTGENATITWTTHEVANSVVLYEAEGNDFVMVAGDSTVMTDVSKYASTHTVNVRNLIPASKYLFSVMSADASGNIGQSAQSTFTTKEPSSLSSIKVLSKALGQATISWTTGSATSSLVEYGLTTSYGSIKEDSSKVKEHLVTLSDLTPGETYHFRVKGEDEEQNTFASSDITFQPKSPPKISGFKIDSITEHGAIVTYSTNVPTDSLVTYSDVEDENNSGFQGRPEIATKHETKLKDLSSGTEFSVKLKVRDEEGNETEETFPNFITTKDEAPPKIDRVKTDSALTQNDKVQAIISWSTDELSTGDILYKEGKAGDEKKFEVNSALSFSHIGVITSFKSGVVYYFKVKSTDSAGNTVTSSDYALLTPKQRQNIIQVIIGNFTDIFGWAKF